MRKVVNNPKKQINLSISLVSSYYLDKIRYYSPHLRSVHILTNLTEYTNQFDFSIFNNIPIVRLEGFYGVTEITDGLQNIQELLLSIQTLEKLYDLNGSSGINGSLRKLELIECPCLKIFPIQMSTGNDVQNLVTRPNLVSCIKLIFQAPNNHVLDMTRLFTNYLHVFDIEVCFKMDHIHENSALAFCPNLNLVNEDKNCHHQPFPVFYGKTLELVNFDLSSWERTKELSEIISLSLHSCILVTELPLMPKLERLILSNIKGITTIPTYPLLKKLKLLEIPTICQLDQQPNLEDIEIYDCNQLIDWSVFDGQHFRNVIIRNCNYLEDFSIFRNSKNLSIQKCSNVNKIRFYDSILPSYQRSLLINLIQFPLEFTTKISNLRALTLISFPDLQLDTVRIESIDDLCISTCHHYYSTTNLFQITKSFILSDCNNFISLQNLQNIPKIAIGSLPRLADISGLGNHDCLYIYDTPYLEESARTYKEDLIEKKAHENPNYQIFSTIKKVVIIFPRTNVFSFSWEDVFCYNSEYLWDSTQKNEIYDNEDGDMYEDDMWL